MINRFEDEFAFLSNFYTTQNPVKVGNIVFNTNEHFYQAHKTLDLKDRVWVAEQLTPAKAKRAGSKKGLKGRKIQLRGGWEIVKDDVMYTGLLLKFMNNYDIAGKLMATESHVLIEGNHWHDNYWGDCYCDRCTNIRGVNRLGLQLMLLRTLLANIRI